MLEGFRLQTTAGAGGICIRGPPGRVGGLVALPGCYLMDPPGDELAQSHEGQWGQGGRVVVVPGVGKRLAH